MRARFTAALALVALAGSARAEEPRSIESALRVGEDPCLTRESLAKAVAFWLQRSTLTEHVDFDVKRANGDVVFVTTRDGAIAGERRLQQLTGSCADVTDAVGLAIALTIDATLLDRNGVEPTPVPPPVVRHPPPLPRPPLAVHERIAHAGADAHAFVMLDVLPGWMGGADAGAFVRLADVIALHASVLGASGSETSIGVGKVDASLVAGSVSACAEPRFHRARFGACAGLAAGAALARGQGFSPSFSATIPWVALDLGARATFAITRWLELSLGFDAVVSLVRPTFEVIDSSGVSTAKTKASTVGAAANFGPSFTFW